jgi:hypothetical protein
VGDVQRSVGTAVVCDDDLARDLEFPDGVVSLRNAGPQGLGLIEARHDDREFQRCLSVVDHCGVAALPPHLHKGGIPRQLDRDALFT